MYIFMIKLKVTKKCRCFFFLFFFYFLRGFAKWDERINLDLMLLLVEVIEKSDLA